MQKLDIAVTGMSCGHCEKAVVNALEDIGVKATASHSDNIVTVEFEPEKITLDAIKEEIKDVGYTVG